MTPRALAILLFVMAPLGVTAPAAAEDDAGKRVFVEHKCNKCHRAPGVEGGKHDLAGVGKTRDAAWLKKYLLKEVAGDKDRKHLVKFAGEDKDLDALVAWLASLK